jgi:hypothetical protein
MAQLALRRTMARRFTTKILEKTCASAAPAHFTATGTTSVPWDFGEQAFVGFTNLFLNGQISGLKDLALGTASLFPTPLNIGISLATSGQGQGVALAAFNGIAPVAKGKAGVARAARELAAAGNKVIGQNVTIETAGGTRIVADLIVEAPDGTRVIVEVKNGVSAGFTANQIITGLAEGGSISGVVRGTGQAVSTLKVGEALSSVASFVIRYIH